MRLLGKNTSKDFVDIGEKVLAKISRGIQSQRKQALQARWKDAVWVGTAKMSNEHIVALEDGGHAVRCRTIKRRPKQDHLGNRRHAEEAQPERARQEGDGDGRHHEVREARAVDQTRGPCRGRSGSQEFQDHQRDLEKMWPHARMHWLRGGARRRDQRQDRTHMPAVTGSRSRCLRTQMRKGGLSNEMRGGQQARQRAHQLPQKFCVQCPSQQGKVHPGAEVDGSLQKMTEMLLDLEFGKTRDHRENVTSIIESLADQKNMCTPHNDDEKWADMFRDTVFVDNVNGGNELDTHLVIEVRKTEMEFFKKMAVYPKGS